MGNQFYEAVVYYDRAHSTTGFRDLDRAVAFGRDRAFDPRVSKVDITLGGTVIWTASRLDELRGEVVANTDR